MALKKLNCGCGADIRAGWINLDKHALPGVDVLHDIESLPLPFPDEEFDEVLCQDVFEHVEYVATLRDIHRVLKKGGRVVVRVPHFSSRRNYIDPTHKKMFSIHTFDYFVTGKNSGRDYYFDFHFERMEATRITFEKTPFLYNYPVEWCVNASRRIKETVYEATFLSRLFPADNVLVTLIK